MSEACEHDFRYQGVVWHLGERLSGSDARERIYEDRYYCSKCLVIVDRSKRVHHNSYSKPIEGSFPK